VSAAVAQSLQGSRGPIHLGEQSVLAFARETGIRFDVGRLAYLSHWITPLGRVKRFDTRFFVAEAPAGQVAAHDGTEMTDHRWIRPADALSAGDALKLMGPTRATLTRLQHFGNAASLMAWARSPRDVPLIFPRIANGAQGERHVLPEEHSWAEIGRLDPQGLGTASYDIVPGRPVRLSSRIIRVTASNAGVMTGPGTNSYLVGGGARNEWVVIDPGPVDAAHVQAIIDAAPGRITRVFATHTHSDHSPGAALLKARTDAITQGRVADHADRQDKTFIPDVALAGGERIEIDEGVTLRVIHTPGHASNHLCYLLEETRMLFTGDHMMQGSTVVINPPDGDMRAYLASLERLAALDLATILPGHGPPIDRPYEKIAEYVAHRLMREAQIVAAVAAGVDRIAEMVPRLYAEVPAALHGMASLTVRAHLDKLVADERVTESDGRFTLR
jgi:glyoxylase-like metal-dependent hydrolase (beta-lactamase superfamily II)